MTNDISFPASTGRVIAALRAEVNSTQGQVAQSAGIDQSRISRIEKGEVVVVSEVTRVLEALLQLGSANAGRYLEYLRRDWAHVERPAFWNPHIAAIETAETTLSEIDEFISRVDPPWPLRRQLERQKNAVQSAAIFLDSTSHQIAFIGDIAVGKSTALSFLFDLLVPGTSDGRRLERVVLETGGGRITICEVHIRRGPQFGVSIQPHTESDLRDLVGDFAASLWLRKTGKAEDSGETVGVSEEIGRAIRNMADLTIKKDRAPSGKTVRRDTALEFAQSCASEDELRTKIIDRMHAPERNRREIWFDPTIAKSPMQWMWDTFRAANNGRLSDVSLPRTIDLLIPEFGEDAAGLDISVVDTKGVDDIAVREDLDQRLRDPRTAVVLCTRFHDAPNTTVQLLLRHMKTTFGERIDTGKVSILALPRSGEAMAVKDDAGEPPADDADGYDLKREQIERTLGASEHNVGGVPINFFNVETDDAGTLRRVLFEQVARMRESHAIKIQNLCAATDDLIKNHEAQAVNAAIEEVSDQLAHFLAGNKSLKSRERHAYSEALKAVDSVRYASTLWAATRRNGAWGGLNLPHLIGTGAAQDALLRSRDFFTGLTSFLQALRANADLALAHSTVEQIERSAEGWRKSFAEAARTAGMEVYRDPLAQANMLWIKCAGEWGNGPGFKVRVSAHLKAWFENESALKDKLEEITGAMWEEKVIGPLSRLTNKIADETIEDQGHKVIDFSARRAAK